MMHTCSGKLQSRLGCLAVPGHRRAVRNQDSTCNLATPCRRKLHVCARAASKASRQSSTTQKQQEHQVEEPQSIDSLDGARESFKSLFGEESAALEVLSKAEEAYQEDFLDDTYMDSLTGMANEIAGLASKAEIGASEKLKQAENQAKAATDKYLRLNADFDNFRKRSANEREQLGDRTRGDVIKNLIPLVDSFEAAQTSVSAETENEKKINGAYQGLYKQMVEAFKGLGVEAVPGVGQPFDPNFHEAIMREANESLPDGTVLQEFRRGFRLGTTLLRPGMVKVSYSEGPAQTDPAEANGAELEAQAEQAIDVEVEESS